MYIFAYDLFYIIHIYHMYVYRKNIFSQTQHFLHLNLSIALLFGLVTFVSGIETATEYRVSDVFIFQVRSLVFVLGNLSCRGYIASLFLYGSILLDA